VTKYLRETYPFWVAGIMLGGVGAVVLTAWALVMVWLVALIKLTAQLVF